MHPIKKTSQKSTFIHLFILFIAICLTAGCAASADSRQSEQKKSKIPDSRQTLSYNSITIPINTSANSTLVYHPVDNVLSQIKRKGHIYTLCEWQPETGWTTSTKQWKTKKNHTLDNFSYNTNGVLYACQKRRRKGKLISQTLVRLRSNGKIQKVRLTDLNRLSSSPAQLPEITDIQCNGTSIAITYQYGSVKIYNLAEGQALGASSITGTPGKNTFYDLHYLSIITQKGSPDILLRDYDIRSGELTRSFPLGGAGQSIASYHISNYQNDLYLLTNRGLFAGQCSGTALTQLLTYQDLKLPEQSRIVYLQASRDASLYLGYRTGNGDFQLRLITTPDPGNPTPDTRQSSHRSPANI